jgi:hypothetical protein
VHHHGCWPYHYFFIYLFFGAGDPTQDLRHVKQLGYSPSGFNLSRPRHNYPKGVLLSSPAFSTACFQNRSLYLCLNHVHKWSSPLEFSNYPCFYYGLTLRTLLGPCSILNLISRPPSGHACAAFQLSLPSTKTQDGAEQWWLTPAILAPQDAEIRRIEVQSQSRQIVCGTLSKKKKQNPSQKKAGGVAQGIGSEFNPPPKKTQDGISSSRLRLLQGQILSPKMRARSPD